MIIQQRCVLRAGSYTTMALVAGAAEDASYPDSLAALRELVKPADGIVLGTPEN